ncbi:MAG: UDP-N-acetylmuramoyl-tripeptide--D-alanyl-D-alanine ligase [Casimicrobiaceae bacterium]
MPMMTTAEAARAMRGRVIGEEVMFSRVVSDTRRVAAGDLFFALRGARFDGHDFVAGALEEGAVAAVVANERAPSLHGNLIAVDEPLAALGALAAAWRRRFAIPVVAVAGSNGKTTTKEMIASVFRAGTGDATVVASPGNFNNAIGLPLSVLALRATHRLAVFEIGMNHRGETRELAAIAQPTIAVICNAQREHQEFMRSVDEVAAEHADLVRALPPGGQAVLNADDPGVGLWREVARDAGAKTIDFGLDRRAMVSGRFETDAGGSRIELATPAGAAAVRLSVAGRPMVMNALAAAATGIAAGVSIASIVRGLEAFRPVAGRLAPRAGIRGSTIIDDSYNANPDSMRAAIDVLAARGGERWLAIGDMGETGSEGAAFHREAGAQARAAGIDRLDACGVLAAEAVAAFGSGAVHHASAHALADALHTALLRAGRPQAVTVLVKGSRFMKMEEVVAALCGGGSVDAGGAAHANAVDARGGGH